MTTTANTNDTFARSFEDAAVALARLGVAMTTHTWQRELHTQAKATLERVESNVNRARRYRANDVADKENPT